jgi:hypothetical protein
MADGRLSTSSFLPPDEIDCLLDTVAAWTQRLFHQMADAFMSAEGDAPLALHRALAAMLREMRRRAGLGASRDRRAARARPAAPRPSRRGARALLHVLGRRPRRAAGAGGQPRRDRPLHRRRPLGDRAPLRAGAPPPRAPRRPSGHELLLPVDLLRGRRRTARQHLGSAFGLTTSSPAGRSAALRSTVLSR